MVHKHRKGECFLFLWPVIFAFHEKGKRHLEHRLNFISVGNRHKIRGNQTYIRRDQIIMKRKNLIQRSDDINFFPKQSNFFIRFTKCRLQGILIISVLLSTRKWNLSGVWTHFTGATSKHHINLTFTFQQWYQNRCSFADSGIL